MYQTHRIFCAVPWELEQERRAFYDVVGQFNEAAAMRRGVLFIPVSITAQVLDKRPFQSDVEQNIRACRHYIQVLAADWGPLERNFETDCRLAIQCVYDPQLPMAAVAIFAKKPSSIPLPDGIVIREFSDSDDFKAQLGPLLSDWLRRLTDGGS